MSKEKRIVVIGGGTGILPVLDGLKKETDHISAIVTMADDGGSTGILREEFGILPPGDIRRVLIALGASDQSLLAKLMSYRFEKGSGLAGHSFGNLMLTALQHITGDFEKAIGEAQKLLGAKGQVIPVTLNSTHLVAELEDGTIVKGESNVDIPTHDARLSIKRIWLEPSATVNPRAKQAILDADAIIIGPGDLYTSILPNLIVEGMKEALQKTEATIIYFVNLLTKRGETNHFNATDFMRVVEEYIGPDIMDYIIVNTGEPSLKRLKPYILEHAELVKADIEARTAKPIPILSDLVRDEGLIRHDAEKVRKVVMSLL